jgi:hypothetical protein
VTATFPVPPWPTVDWSQGETQRELEDRELANLANVAPRIGWQDFIRTEFHWYAGEHVAAIGPTGTGKTFLISHLLPLRRYVAVFGTKPADRMLDSLVKQRGYKLLQAWPSNLLPIDRANNSPKRVLWPEVRQLNDLDATTKQKLVFEDALWRIFREGGWTVALDETSYLVQELGLGRWIKRYLLQARELKISLIAASQRPAWVPLEIYDQSTHLFLWRDNDETNLARIAGFSVHSGSFIRRVVANLEQYQALYINTRTGQMLRTRAPAEGT